MGNMERGRPDAAANLRHGQILDSKIGSWTIGERIGGGSSTEVKVAKNIATGDLIAVKAIPLAPTRSIEAQEKGTANRVTREAAVLTLLYHPHIASIRDIFWTEHYCYLLLDYIEDGSLLDYIAAHGRLKHGKARKFARQIASALDYCHKNNIVHRDIKIEHVMLNKKGDVKLIDFSLSKCFSEQSHLDTFCGSSYFAAPELLTSTPYIGPKVDVWSFGIVLYVLVCGSVPFDDTSMPTLREKIKSAPVQFPPRTSDDFRSLVSGMLEKDPALRYTLDDVINDPWMMKGEPEPIDNFLPRRRPITLPLDQDVIHQMSTLGFGSSSEIYEKLEKAIKTSDYQLSTLSHVETVETKTSDTTRLLNDGTFQRLYHGDNNSQTPLLYGNMVVAPPSDAMTSIYHLVCEKMERDMSGPKPGSISDRGKKSSKFGRFLNAIK